MRAAAPAVPGPAPERHQRAATLRAPPRRPTDARTGLLGQGIPYERIAPLAQTPTSPKSRRTRHWPRRPSADLFPAPIPNFHQDVPLVRSTPRGRWQAPRFATSRQACTGAAARQEDKWLDTDGHSRHWLQRPYAGLFPAPIPNFHQDVPLVRSTPRGRWQAPRFATSRQACTGAAARQEDKWLDTDGHSASRASAPIAGGSPARLCPPPPRRRPRA